MKYIIIALLSILLGYGISNEYFPRHIVLTKSDTITVIPEPIVIEKITPKLVFRTDTLIETRPFVAIIDTIYRTDTIKIAYKYPENEMQLAIRMATDTIYKSNDILLQDCKSQQWWETPAIATGGILLGILLTQASK